MVIKMTPGPAGRNLRAASTPFSKGKHAPVTDLLADLVAVSHFHKETLQAFRGALATAVSGYIPARVLSTVRALIPEQPLPISVSNPGPFPVLPLRTVSAPYVRFIPGAPQSREIGPNHREIKAKRKEVRAGIFQCAL